MLDLKPQTHCSKNKRLVWFNVGWISARNQATENSSKATIHDTLRAIQGSDCYFFGLCSVYSFRLSVSTSICRSDSVTGCGHSWLERLEGSGASAVDGLKLQTGLSVTLSTFPPMVCWALVFCWAGTYRLTCLHNTAQIHYFRPRGTEWPLPSGELHQIPSQHDKPNTLATVFNTLIMIASRDTELRKSAEIFL